MIRLDFSCIGLKYDVVNHFLVKNEIIKDIKHDSSSAIIKALILEFEDCYKGEFYEVDASSFDNETKALFPDVHDYLIQAKTSLLISFIRGFYIRKLTGGRHLASIGFKPEIV